MGFDQFDSQEAITEINVTPLVDITLVLLIVFMVTSSYIVNPAIKVDLPKAKSAEQSAPSTVSLAIDARGQLHLNGRVVSQARLRERVRAELAAEPTLRVVISADRRLAYGKVVALLDLVKQLGVRRYALNIKYDEVDN